MGSLLKSRKFWTAIVDVVLSTVIFFVTKYLAPEIAEDVVWLIGSYQPIFALVIAGIFIEDKAALEAGAHPSQQ